MTRLTVVFSTFIIAILISAGAYLYSVQAASALNAVPDMNAYTARKEDLVASQLKLDQQLAYINQTLQASLQKQEELTQQVKTLSAQAGMPAPVTKPAPVATVPIIVPTPTPKPQPMPKPVTRAS